MKYLIFYVLVLTFSTNAIAAKHVKSYTRKDGTYVQGHTKSSSDTYRFNNKNSNSNGGNRRDEFSNYGATNKSNSSYRSYDNDKDGISNAYDRKPESGNNW